MADTLELNVTGMSCDGCSGSVNTVVSKLAGVEKVVAEHQPTNKVTVTGTALDRAAIVATRSLLQQLALLGGEAQTLRCSLAPT